VPGKRTGFDFEHTLAELEALVTALESGDLPLEESLKRFERGVQLARACQKALADAEQKVKLLLEKTGETELVPFDTATADDAG
jgi:exodeoxyribonuclease VII small subunit